MFVTSMYMYMPSKNRDLWAFQMTRTVSAVHVYLSYMLPLTIVNQTSCESHAARGPKLQIMGLLKGLRVGLWPLRLIGTTMKCYPFVSWWYRWQWDRSAHSQRDRIQLTVLDCKRSCRFFLLRHAEFPFKNCTAPSIVAAQTMLSKLLCLSAEPSDATWHGKSPQYHNHGCSRITMPDDWSER